MDADKILLLHIYISAITNRIIIYALNIIVHIRLIKKMNKNKLS